MQQVAHQARRTLSRPSTRLVLAMQVESGQVDMIQDTKAFWATMMHTLPQYMQDQGVQPKKPTEKERADSRGGPG